MEIACFISPHGFGHATRAIAILEALAAIRPDLRAHLFTTVPEVVFTNISIPYRYHPVVTDVGLIQANAFAQDMTQTTAALREFFCFHDNILQECARLSSSCRAVLCDISVLGIMVGQMIGFPSILVENFTWDWIYRHMGFRETPEQQRWINFFGQLYGNADFRIQTEPLCSPAECVATCPPIARTCKIDAAEVRRILGGRGRKIVLITMGGIPFDLPFISRLGEFQDYLFVIAGQKKSRSYSENIRLLGHDTALHHPDLIRAAHLLVCKSGYSTIAECAQTTTPICCVGREGFPESLVLENFVKKEMRGTIISLQQFTSGFWLEELPQLIGRRRKGALRNGAGQAAAAISSLL